jgi:hypothetical protein
LGRWADAQSSQGEVRARSKIGRIAGRIPFVFRHRSDENGVGWSDFDSPAKLGFQSGIDTPLGQAVCGILEGTPAPEAVVNSRDGEAGASLEYSTSERALIAACATRFLLICDAEGTVAGQAAKLKGDSLEGSAYQDDARLRSPKARSSRRGG